MIEDVDEALTQFSPLLRRVLMPITLVHGTVRGTGRGRFRGARMGTRSFSYFCRQAGSKQSCILNGILHIPHHTYSRRLPVQHMQPLPSVMVNCR